ncbi:hypothetical protein LOK49_LG12G03076 [Camellia lanceoleosa]|uniref:Uncharacterized protein n=1 Tax=Camellia lanceoleosa TaxID=1840588 RepID=A0ACC0FXI8_9ERIC|nr:hypothetical protein LOK49_LG12G03076 [Camellia lanceoleosa]
MYKTDHSIIIDISYQNIIMAYSIEHITNPKRLPTRVTGSGHRLNKHHNEVANEIS